MSTIKEGYYKSQDRFEKIDGNNFGACMKQVFDIKNDAVLEWRIRKSDQRLCIIQFYERGNGYTVFEIEKFVYIYKSCSIKIH